jgi:Kdo2-lipid IVA lauroyltransferase/acyltransferase
MNNIKYFLQFIIIFFLFLIFRLLGLKYSSILSGYIMNLVGFLFRSKKICNYNLSIAFPKMTISEKNKLLKNMWFNYGRILAEYIFIVDFRNKANTAKKILVHNQKELEKIKNSSKPVIFVSGHFNNFELMAMHLEKSGIDLAAIYRPLNNKFLNPLMEKIRKKYICKKQIKKGKSGTKEILKHFKSGGSIALMIDQRVSEGIACKFFNKEALTTTIPAQFVKKFGAQIVPIYIERLKNNDFKLKIYDSLNFHKDDSIDSITLKLNKILEEMIILNPEQWIWTHNRWK